MGKRIAVFGKGGIGKSTIVSNLSTIWSLNNKNVLQVGCDPKHDSTLLLTSKPIKPLLEMNECLLDSSCLNIVTTSVYGIGCIEIGGPEPGIGCAGRGISRGIDILESHGILNSNYDIIVFDILGDVVCGGFFAPMKKNTDEMYIVTSGEFNSLFAANNLCKGYMNNALGDVKFGGIIGNIRGNLYEKNIIECFADKIGVPLMGIVSKDSVIEQCTFERIPVIVKEPSHYVVSEMIKIANKIMINKGVAKVNYFELEELREFFHEIVLINN